MITVLIPWRPSPSRLEAFVEVAAWYRGVLGATVIPVDSGDPVFNLAQCRNSGLRSVADAASVVVVGDADTLPERGPLLEAIAAAATSGRVHLPYTEYRWLGAEGTARFRAGSPIADCPSELVRGACSGVYVTTPQTWWSHGGQDERFRGWGYEDAAWYLAHGTLLGEPPRRHDGRVYALHHEPERRDGPQYDANAGLMQRYRDAATDAAAMREVMSATVA